MKPSNRTSKCHPGYFSAHWKSMELQEISRVTSHPYTCTCETLKGPKKNISPLCLWFFTETYTHEDLKSLTTKSFSSLSLALVRNIYTHEALKRLTTESFPPVPTRLVRNTDLRIKGLNNEIMLLLVYDARQKHIHEASTHWGRVTHICVGELTIISSDNDLSPGRRQAIIWTNTGILLIGSLGTIFSEILIGNQTFSFKKMHLKMSSAKLRPFCLVLNVFRTDNEIMPLLVYGARQ